MCSGGAISYAFHALCQVVPHMLDKIEDRVQNGKGKVSSLTKEDERNVHGNMD